MRGVAQRMQHIAEQPFADNCSKEAAESDEKALPGYIASFAGISPLAACKNASMAQDTNATVVDPDRLSFHQGLRTAIAAGLAYWFASLLHLPGAYWAAISAIIVMQSEVGATVLASRDRFIGTILGAVVGWLTAMFWHGYIVIFALAVLLVMVLCTTLRYKNSGRLGGVTVAIIVLAPNHGAIWHFALQRFLEVSLGIAVSLAVALISTKVHRMQRKKLHTGPSESA